MKKFFLIITISAITASCSPGKWVWGNDAHFKKREIAKKAKLQSSTMATAIN